MKSNFSTPYQLNMPHDQQIQPDLNRQPKSNATFQTFAVQNASHAQQSRPQNVPEQYIDGAGGAERQKIQHRTSSHASRSRENSEADYPHQAGQNLPPQRWAEAQSNPLAQNNATNNQLYSYSHPGQGAGQNHPSFPQAENSGPGLIDPQWITQIESAKMGQLPKFPPSSGPKPAQTNAQSVTQDYPPQFFPSQHGTGSQIGYPNQSEVQMPQQRPVHPSAWQQNQPQGRHSVEAQKGDQEQSRSPASISHESYQSSSQRNESGQPAAHSSGPVNAWNRHRHPPRLDSNNPQFPSQQDIKHPQDVRQLNRPQSQANQDPVRIPARNPVGVPEKDSEAKLGIPESESHSLPHTLSQHENLQSQRPNRIFPANDPKPDNSQHSAYQVDIDDLIQGQASAGPQASQTQFHEREVEPSQQRIPTPPQKLIPVPVSRYNPNRGPPVSEKPAGSPQRRRVYQPQLLVPKQPQIHERDSAEPQHQSVRPAPNLPDPLDNGDERSEGEEESDDEDFTWGSGLAPHVKERQEQLNRKEEREKKERKEAEEKRREQKPKDVGEENPKRQAADAKASSSNNMPGHSKDNQGAVQLPEAKLQGPIRLMPGAEPSGPPSPSPAGDSHSHHVADLFLSVRTPSALYLSRRPEKEP